VERLLRYCARPPFACARLRKAGSELVYRCAKQHSEPGSDRRDQRSAKRGAKHGAQADELHLTPLELIVRLAALVPPPRSHLIAFITYSADIRQILEHIGVDAELPRITPARGPPLWDGCDAPMGEGVDVAPDWDEAA